MKPLSFLR